MSHAYNKQILLNVSNQSNQQSENVQLGHDIGTLFNLEWGYDKMKKIIKYQAYTGCTFDNKEDCLQYEEQCRKMEKINKHLTETNKERVYFRLFGRKKINL